MASEIGVQTIQHTNGTDAMTINSSGHVHIPVVQVQYREYKGNHYHSNQHNWPLSCDYAALYLIKVEFHIGIFSFYRTCNTSSGIFC